MNNNQVNLQQFKKQIRILAKYIGLFDKVNASCCGLTAGQCQAIVEIGIAKEISLRELAKLLNLDTSTMSRNINILVEQGYVLREMDQEDRRYVKLILSEKGGRICHGLKEAIDLYFSDVLEAIPAEKREQVLESLDLLVNALTKVKCC